MSEISANGNGAGFVTRVQALIAGAALVILICGGFWGAVISPMQSAILRIEDGKLSIREHDEFKSRQDIARITLETDIRRELDATIHRLDALERSIVTRAELEVHWKGDQDRIAEVGSRLAELRTQLASTYTVGDELKALQKRIDDLAHQAK